MRTCRTALCSNRDLRPVRIGIAPAVHLYCSACVTTIRSFGGYVREVERRVADVPVAEDRRRFKPVWLSRLTARDETGRAA